MNIDVREYLRINPISVHELTLSNNQNDCFLWFSQDGQYDVVTQKQMFDCLYKSMFGGLLDENMDFKVDVDLDGETPIIIWDESAHISDGQFDNYATREAWEAFKERLENELESLEREIDSKMQLLRRNGTLNYPGAVELQSRLVDVNNIYSDFLHGKGLMWCYDASEKSNIDRTSERAEMASPLSHIHKQTKAETMTSPFTTKRGGGDIVGDFTVGGKVMASNGDRYGRSVGYSMEMMDSEPGSDLDLTYPLGGQNVIDWRTRGRTHNNMPPVTDIWIRYKEHHLDYNLPTIRFAEAMVGQQEQIEDEDAQMTTRDCIIEPQYDSKKASDLEDYGKSSMTEHDFLLRLQLDDETKEVQLRKQTLNMLLTIFSEDGKQRYGKVLHNGDEEIVVSVGEILRGKLDDDLATKSEFSQWCSWVNGKLKEIQDKLKTIRQLVKSAKPLVYVGRIIVSTTDDTEMKVIEHYGGKKWRRIVNFLRGVGENDELGRKWGEEYVCLRESNVPIHQHGVQLNEARTTGDAFWMCADRSGVETKMLNKKKDEHDAGVSPAKNIEVEYQISPLEYERKSTPTIPHDNLPPYKEVYIWECVEITEEEEELLRERIAVKWDSHGGTYVGNTLYSPEERIGTLPKTTRDGYDFADWWTQESGGVQVDEDTIVTESVTYHAHWNSKEYSIFYEMNGHGEQNPEWHTTYRTGDEYTPTPYPTDDEYTFIRWKPQRISKGDFGDKTFLAIWNTGEFKITWNQNHPDSTDIIISQNYGDSLQIPENVARTGYMLNGWWTEREGGQQVDGTMTVDGDATYYAHWKTQIYTISYEMKGHGERPQGAPTSYTIESETIVPPRPEDVEHYEFRGWSPESIQKGSWGDKTFNANWIENGYTITFMYNDGTSTSVKRAKKVNETIGSLPTPSRTGYSLAGWWTEQLDGHGRRISSDDVVTGDATYYAHWGILSYNIIYNMNGHGEKPHDGKSTYTVAELPYAIPDPSDVEGYEFKGWSPSVIQTGTARDVTVDASWEARLFTIHFVHHDGTSAVTTRQMRYDSEMGELPSPQWQNHNFLGWWTSETGEGKQAFPQTIVKGDFTWHGRWEMQTYSISFNPGKGTCSETTRQVEAGSPYGTLPTATRHGFDFAGWWTNQNNGTQVNGTDIPSSDGTLYAHWSGKTYNRNQMPYIETSRQYNSDKYTLFDSVQGGSGVKFNLVFTDILVGHKGKEDDHRVYLRLWAVNKDNTSQQTMIGVAATIVKGGNYVRNGTCTTSSGTNVPTVYVWGLKNQNMTLSLKYENLTIPYANAQLKIQLYTPDTSGGDLCKGAILYRNGTAKLTAVEP